MPFLLALVLAGQLVAETHNPRQPHCLFLAGEPRWCPPSYLRPRDGGGLERCVRLPARAGRSAAERCWPSKPCPRCANPTPGPAHAR